VNWRFVLAILAWLRPGPGANCGDTNKHIYLYEYFFTYPELREPKLPKIAIADEKMDLSKCNFIFP
jgi:hypothetical protein